MTHDATPRSARHGSAAANILLITADDMHGTTPGCFGGPAEATPRLDRLASQGTIFRRAHVPVAVCQPSRSALLTGRWPHRNGAEGFQPIADGVPLLTDVLRKAGYLAGILGKVEHLQPAERFVWDLRLGMRELGMGRGPAAYGRAAAEYFDRASRSGQPWFLMANAHDPHRPFHGSALEQERFSGAERAAIPAPSKVFAPGEEPVPGFLPDIEGVRTEYAEYLSSSRRCDDVAGAVLDALDATGHADDTVVVFLSDNGMAFPFAKANCYLQSTLTPLIIRWPGVTRPRTAHDTGFVSTLDLFPTFCAAAGAVLPDGLDGRSLLPLLGGEQQQDRDAVFTVFHETAAKNRFEMRCVQTAEFGYIRNYWSDGETEYRAENMTGLSWNAMRADPALAARVDFYLHRVPEELYDLHTDPSCLANLAGNPGHAEILARMRKLLAEWMTTTADPLGRHGPSVRVQRPTPE